MRIDRLNAVAEAVAKQPVEQFYMGTWANDYPDCGTAACAIGSYCLQNPQSALKLSKVPELGTILFPTFKGKHAFEAVAEFLDISLAQALFLFDPGAYETLFVTKCMVLRRMDNFVRSGGDIDPDQATYVNNTAALMPK